ncbi:MAG: hypothetical protein ACRD52_13360, partial [Candidatus Acidiferrales bacterium]
MPKTTPRPASDATTFDPKSAPKFVRCDLNADQKVLLQSWASEVEHQELLAWIETAVSRGHTISIRSNDVGYQCSLTGTR